MRRWIIVLVLGLLPGCDVATAALLLGSQNKSSSDDGPPLPAPGPAFGNKFQAWTALIPAGNEDLEKADLISKNGDPSVISTWTFIGNAAATAIFDPSAAPGDFNAILIQATSVESYSLDCVEIFDTAGNIVEHASGTPYSNLVTNENAILGPPDTVAAVTNATTQDMAFIFTIYTQPIDRFRINSQGATLPVAPGDLIAKGDYVSVGNERPGGMAIDANGLIHLTLTVGDTVRLVRYNLAGIIPTPIAPDQNDIEVWNDFATAGSHSVALNSVGVVFTATSIAGGVIQVRRFEPNLAAGNVVGFTSGFNGDRVEHNAIAVDGSGDLVVVGGFSSLLSGRNHWRVKIPDTVTGAPLWQSSASLDNSSVTYWHAVTTGPNDEAFMTGDRLTVLLGGTNQIYTGQFNDAGVAVWDDEFPEGDQPADVGHAIALDDAGNIYVGGSVGTDTDGRDGVLLRYAAGGGSVVDVDFKQTAPLDDEILDIALDTDGSIYAVGYDNIAGQGENWLVKKYTYDVNLDQFTVEWARSHDSGFGNDHAISVAISGNTLVVAGFETNATGQTKLVLRMYEK